MADDLGILQPIADDIKGARDKVRKWLAPLPSTLPFSGASKSDSGEADPEAVRQANQTFVDAAKKPTAAPVPAGKRMMMKRGK